MFLKWFSFWAKGSGVRGEYSAFSGMGWTVAGWQDFRLAQPGVWAGCLSLEQPLAANRSYYSDPRTTVGSLVGGSRKPGLSLTQVASRVLPAALGLQ